MIWAALWRDRSFNFDKRKPYIKRWAIKIEFRFVGDNIARNIKMVDFKSLVGTII